MDFDINSKTVNKLIDTVSSGICTLAYPWHASQKAAADADVALLNAKARKEVRQSLEAMQGEAPLPERIETRLTFQEEKRQANIENISLKAFEHLPEDDEMVDDPVDPDWIARFFTTARDVSHEEMQTLWAKVLAAEVVRPKSFSLRTLETIGNLDADEAQIIEKILRYAVSGNFLVRLPDDVREEIGIRTDELLLLKEIGVISSGPESGRTDRFFSKSQENYEMDLLYGEYIFRVSKDDPTASFELPTIDLTRIGKDLWPLAQHVTDDKYVQHLAFQARSQGFEIQAAMITKWLPDKRANYSPFVKLKAG